MAEQRRTHRSPLEAPVEVQQKGAEGSVTGSARDLSVGGMFVETTTPLPFGAAVVVRVRLPGFKDELALPAVVRWTRQDGMGLQFGLIGARESHAITEIVRKTGG